MNERFSTAFLSYESKELIGEGGASWVYKVLNPAGNKYALKLLKQELNKYNRFINEFNFLINNHHDNLVEVIDSGKTDEDIPFYIMPLASSTLRDYINNKNLTLQSKIKIMNDILNGLKFLHSKGVIHRDLKPENILIYKDTAKIADLGIAHFYDDDKVENTKTKKTDRFANFQYAAPEQRIRNNTENLTQACDIYSFALIVHELFTGEYTSGNRSQKISDFYPEYDYIDKILEKSLHENPNFRIQNAIDFFKELELAKYDIDFPPYDARSLSQHFKYDRFDKAFPDIDRQYIFTDKDIILKRLKKLLRPPYKFSNPNDPNSYFDSIWWSRGYLNSDIIEVKINEQKKLIYIDGIECSIKKLVAFDSSFDYRKFVYLEIEGMPKDSTCSFVEEEICILNGKRISSSEANSGFYINDDGNSVKIDNEKLERFIRHYEPWNLLILSHWHPFIKNPKNDMKLVSCMDSILNENLDVEELRKLAADLPNPDFYDS